MATKKGKKRRRNRFVLIFQKIIIKRISALFFFSAIIRAYLDKSHPKSLVLYCIAWKNHVDMIEQKKRMQYPKDSIGKA